MRHGGGTSSDGARESEEGSQSSAAFAVVLDGCVITIRNCAVPRIRRLRSFEFES